MKTQKSIKEIVATKAVRYIFFVICILLLILIGVLCFHTSSLTLKTDEKINNTPISVDRLRQIGEWEFLSISDEEIVDTTRRAFWGDDELIRIYYGTLRLGVDMKDIKDDAIKVEGDSITIQLPEMKLLDENFIDEARTQSFYEKGKWDGTAYEALYAKAKRQMKEHCLTEENKQTAHDNAVAEMKKMLIALGVTNASVR